MLLLDKETATEKDKHCFTRKFLLSFFHLIYNSSLISHYEKTLIQENASSFARPSTIPLTQTLVTIL